MVPDITWTWFNRSLTPNPSFFSPENIVIDGGYSTQLATHVSQTALGKDVLWSSAAGVLLDQMTGRFWISFQCYSGDNFAHGETANKSWILSACR
ncbi:numb-associated kinase [Culex quinquefasciatus]|uniref:Numb-associated kinase n=1 Tax=Culex quinquefasciatus TaxID=7176 RepID=B0WNK7_CULQU|nr:numb-associated kinase [Culex quinquefasciatus]|eukprot:XP_001850291.1 numb-associated kinase [Culex quinquefasciatus]